jgi:oligopeptide transport system permease protein
MMRFIAGRLVGALVVLWIIVTLSFFLMRFAPGGPFDADRKLPPNVEANKWLLFGMGVEVVAPVSGTIQALTPLVLQRETYAAGTALATIAPADGSAPVVVALPHEGIVVSLGLDPATAVGTAIEKGARLAVVPKPLHLQYVDAIANYVRLDFGVTFMSDGTRAVTDELARALPVSFQLGAMAMIVALLLGIPAGLLAGLRQNTWVDWTVMSSAMVGVSVPTMVSGPLLIGLLALGAGLFPVGGWEASDDTWSTWQYRVLPVFTLALAYVPTIARLTRGGMLEVIRSDWIRTARAKGVSEFRIVTRHALKGALLPTVSWLGPGVASIVTGSIVVERIYGIPGLSEYFVTPAINRDYPMVIGVIVVYSAILVLLNLIVDIAYTALDPRVRVH